MAKRFFNADNSFWSWIGRLPELCGLSLLWAVLCLPVITIVPATCALYDAAARNLRPDEKGVFRRFFRTFRKELGRGILMSLLWLIIAGILWLGRNAIFAMSDSGTFAAGYALVYQILSLLPLAIFLWAVVLESRFVYSFWQLHKNAVLFAFSYLPQTALMLLICLLAVVLCWYVPVLLLAMPAILVLLLSIPVEKVFLKYMPE